MTRSELATLTSDLPAKTVVLGAAAQTPDVRAIGDIKRSGAWAVEADSHFRTWFGAIKLDLRQAQISATERSSATCGSVTAGCGRS